MQKAHQAEQDKIYEEKGLENTKAGYMFPGVRPDEIKEALERRLDNKKPKLPRVKATFMDIDGLVHIVFDQDIMMPDFVEAKFWDILFEVLALSNEDDSMFIGMFSDTRRALQADGSLHPFRFKPTIIKFDRTAGPLGHVAVIDPHRVGCAFILFNVDIVPKGTPNEL